MINQSQFTPGDIRNLGKGAIIISSMITFSIVTGLVLIEIFSQGERIDLWDKAATVGDSFSGHDITEGHHVEGDWVEGSNADIDAAVETFIDYRAERYGETWRVTGGSCGGRTVERVA